MSPVSSRVDAMINKPAIAIALATVVVFGVVSESAFARSGRAGGVHSSGRYSGGGLSAHHYGASRARVGAFVAAPLFFYSPPPAYYNSPFFAAAQPPVYIEQDAAYGVEKPAVASWYYCAGPQAYYPDVKECPGGWQPVAPIPESVPAL